MNDSDTLTICCVRLILQLYLEALTISQRSASVLPPKAGTQNEE